MTVNSMLNQLVRRNAIDAEMVPYAKFVLLWGTKGVKEAKEYDKTMKLGAYSNMRKGGFVQESKMVGGTTYLDLLLLILGARGFVKRSSR